MMTPMYAQTISSLLPQLAAGELTSTQITKSLLDVIEQHDPKIGAYLHVDRSNIQAQALQADKALANGERGKLQGVPIAIKDLINVAGEPCTCSSHILEGYIAPYDATVITKLRDAGAILLGRVNMDEFAMGSSTENAALGITSNPWDLERVPGGSSGGSAAAVAGDMAIASLGSDTGGSIRQPAAFCGCVGLKPSYGRVSRYGLTAFASSLDQIGPITKTVEDAARLLEVIAGNDAKDATSADLEVPDYVQSVHHRSSLAGVKLGVPKEYFIEGLDPEVKQAVEAAVAQMKTLGAEIVEVTLPHAQYAIAVYYIIATAEASANLARFDGIRYGARENQSDLAALYAQTRSSGFGAEVKRRVILGTYMLSSGYYDAYYLKAQRVRGLIRQDFKEAFRQCDALIAPVTPTPAYKKGEKVSDPLTMYLDDILTTSVNLAGNCGMSVPCGYTEEGLPIGVQLIGDDFNEELLLQIAHVYEQDTQWHQRKPEWIT
jgi:aspartyl-tRNA(Asn)/glutamyl-tRNA(Gln) amidotransferase subunit A